MADFPPAYQETDDSQVPGYSPTAKQSKRWRIVTSVEQKKRSIAIIPVQETLDHPTNSAEDDTRSSYQVSFKHPLELQVREFSADGAFGNFYEGPSSLASSQRSLIANIALSTTTPSRGGIAFVNPVDGRIFHDGQDIAYANLPQYLVEPRNPLVLLAFHVASQKLPLPMAWNLEARQVEVPQLESNDLPVCENSSKKKNFWSKDSSKQKRKESMSKLDSVLERQKSMLNSTIRLTDETDNVCATFESDLFSQAASLLPASFDMVSGAHRSWGHVAIDESMLARLRSQSSLFEKWSDAKLECLILLSLITTLEVNLRLQGGSEGKAFVGALTLSTAFGRVLGQEGIPGIVSAALGGLVRGTGSAGFRLDGIFG